MQTMVAAVSTMFNPKTTAQRGTRPQNPTRPPLLPSDPDNVMASRRPKAREVTSRYMSSSTSSSSVVNSRRCPSPLVSRTVTSTPLMTPSTAATLASKRSQSVERGRTGTPRPNSLDFRTGNGVGSGGGSGGEMSAAHKLLFTSTRSLSVSFQGESFSLQVSKTKPAPSSTVRKGTPERRKATTPARGGGGADLPDNSKPNVDQHRWPGRLRQADCMSRSLDWSDERKKLGGGSGNVVRALHTTMADDRASVDGKVSSGSCNAESEREAEIVAELNSATGSDMQSDPIASDTESVSSGSTSGGQEKGGGGAREQRGHRGIVVPARFWQETSNRLRRQPEPTSPLSKNGGGKSATSSKLIVPKRLSSESPVSSPRGVVNSRGQSSPTRGSVWPASPSRLSTSSTSSPSRGISPSRVRNSVATLQNSNTSNTPSILNFATDIRKGKIGENRVVDAHVLRLLYNRLLQWRFVNARADTALSVQRLNAERSFCSAWISTSKLRESVRAKRCELQLLRQKLKLTSILKWQMIYLEDWDLMDQEFFTSLSGVTEALRASTLRLPVVGGAKADVQNVKDAICSAVDVMQAMASSICLLLSKVGDVNSLASELAGVTAKERALLDQCRYLLSTIAAMQVNECSLRTQALQVQRVRPSAPTKE